MNRLIQVIPDTTGWVALYHTKDKEDPTFVPLLGWGLYEDGMVVALVPAVNGEAVKCTQFYGADGELTFEGLTCAHEGEGE